MNETKSYLELDDEPVKVQPNQSVFKPVASLQVKEGATATQDANGNWVNAIGLQSTASHRHVAKQWQAQCTPFSDFVAEVNKQANYKRDIVKPESEIRLQDIETLVDGMPINDAGLSSLRTLIGMPSSVLSYLLIYSIPLFCLLIAYFF